MDLRRTSPPLTRQQKLAVVSIEEVKAQARVTHDSENDLIGDYIEAAFDHLHGPDGWLNGYCLLPETYEFYAASMGTGVDLPLRPLRQTVNAVGIEHRGSAGSYVEVATSLYYLTNEFGTARILRSPGTVWPVTSGVGHALTYRITVLVGHASADEVPSPIRQGIRMLASYWFSQREAAGPAGKAAAQSIPYGLTALCGRYRLAHDHS